MSRHPHNRRERFEIGDRKGRHRAQFHFSYRERVTNPELIERFARRLRDNAKPCSCSMCCNPRRSPWTKGKEKLTMQERKLKGEIWENEEKKLER